VTTGSKQAPVKSPPTNQHPVFLQARCPSCRPTNSVEALKALKRENELVLYRAEMKMIRWMCDGKLKFKLLYVELRQQLGIEDVCKTDKKK